MRENGLDAISTGLFLLFLPLLLRVHEVSGEFELKASGPEDLNDHEVVDANGQRLSVLVHVFADGVALSCHDAAQMGGFKRTNHLSDHFEQVAAIAAVLQQSLLVAEIESQAVEERQKALHRLHRLVSLHFKLL